MQKQTTKTKISRSLKHYHKRKRAHADARACAGFIIFLAMASIIVRMATPIALADHTAINAGLPQNADKQGITTAEIITIEARKQCAARDLGDYCVNDIMAMAWVESRHNAQAVGDQGLSHGILQINQYYHPNITIEQAQNIQFAVGWTLDRLVAYGYPVYRSRAIMKHNGTPNTARTLSYLNNVNNY